MDPKFDRLELNRKILVGMSKINILPWRFNPEGQIVDLRPVSKLRRGIWIGTLMLCALFALYIYVTLVHTVFQLRAMHRYNQFGLQKRLQFTITQ